MQPVKSLTSFQQRFARPQQLILEAVRPKIQGRQVILFGYPNHANCGDHAIYLGELAALERLNATVIYVCDQMNYSANRVRRLSKDTVLLIHGGGNLGDLWMPHERFRERILKDFPDHVIIQLPQSIHFKSAERLESAKQVFAAHSNFHLMVREQQSYDFAISNFDVPVTLVPDMAFMLGALARSGDGPDAVIVLARTDGEETISLANTAKRRGLTAKDWLRPGRGRGINKEDMLIRVIKRMKHTHAASVDRTIDRLVQKIYRQLSTMELRRAAKMLSTGKVVLTDRLHAHLLSDLLGIPHVAVDTGYGKIRGVHDLWMTDSKFAHLANSPEEGCDLAFELARATT